MAPRRDLAQNQIEGLTSFGVFAPTPIYVQSPKFEGSLATLFRCVRDHKVELRDVSLQPICEAYFEYLLSSADSNIDEAGSALTVLAFLLERKAWQLLPSVEPEPEIEEETVLSLPSVGEYRLAIEALRNSHFERSSLFFRPESAGPDPFETPVVMTEIGPQDLAVAFSQLLRRAKPEPPPFLAKNRRSLSETMALVIVAVSDRWLRLTELAPDPITLGEAVMWFLALLELIRLGQVSLRLGDGEVQFARAQR